MIEATIQSIGKNAVDHEESILILFGNTATKGLLDVSIIQHFKEIPTIQLKEGNQLSFGDQQYTIEKVGRIAEKNLNEIGHLSVIFKEAPKEDEMLNAVYVSPYQLPKLNEGMTIAYQ